MQDYMLAIDKLRQHFPRNGKIEWIGLRKSEDYSMLEVSSAELLIGHGLVGDKAGQHRGSKRQVTLIQAEHLEAIASYLNCKSISLLTLKRNIVISGLNLGILKGLKIQVHNAVLEITGNCAPCKKMEQVLGFGGFNAMRNHGGVTALVEKGGIIRVGDEAQVLTEVLAQNRLL